MKRNLILAAVFALCLAATASAQKTVDFSGTWNLDVSKSKPAETRIDSQTLTVTQTATELKVDRATKMKEGATGGGGRPGGGGPAGPDTYSLDGKAVKSQMQTQMGAMDVSTVAKIDGSTFTATRTITTPMGERVSTEKWTLNADGTLSIESERPNRDGGMDTTNRTYTKQK